MAVICLGRNPLSTLQKSSKPCVPPGDVKAAGGLQRLACTPSSGIFCWHAADVDPPEHISPPAVPHPLPALLCWQKGPCQRLPRGLSHAQLSFIQLSSAINSLKNGEVYVILGSQQCLGRAGSLHCV